MSLRQGADELLQRAIDAGDAAGVAAMAIDLNGTIYEGAFGKRVRGEDPPMQLDTVVWLASMSKALTSTGAMQLVERGRLDLESPVSRWLPEIAAAQVLEGFDAEGQPRTRPPQRPVALRHLLTHTAGFGYGMYSAATRQYQQVRELPLIATCQNAALRTPLLFDPGERWEYGISTDWLGKVIEATSGQRLGSYLEENVFGPLGMHDTAFRISASMRERLAKVHQRGSDGQLAPIDLEVPQQPELEMGGSGLYGTARNYLQFVRMILQRGRLDGARVLQAETVEMMARNQTGQVRVTPMRTLLPWFSNDLDFFPGLEKHFGFGFQVNAEAAPTGLTAGSLLWSGVANTYFWIDPARGIGGVLTMQVLPFADPRAAALFLDFQTMVYQAAA